MSVVACLALASAVQPGAAGRLAAGPAAARGLASPRFVPCADVGAGLTGFGVVTTSGDLGAVYWATTLADARPGSLRNGATLPQPLWIRFAVSGTIALKSS